VAAVTNADWGKIHAKAWRDAKFRKLLETDPTKAIRKYGKEVGKTFTKMVKVARKPKGKKEHLEKEHRQPPACC
jgi:hypothetical protein